MLPEDFKNKYQEKLFILVVLIISLSALAIMLFLMSLVYDEVLRELVKDYEWLFVLLFAFVGYLMNRLIEMEKKFFEDNNVSLIELFFYPSALLLVTTVLLIIPSFPWGYIIWIIVPLLSVISIERFFLSPFREDLRKTKEYMLKQKEKSC